VGAAAGRPQGSPREGARPVSSKSPGRASGSRQPRARLRGFHRRDRSLVAPKSALRFHPAPRRVSLLSRADPEAGSSRRRRGQGVRDRAHPRLVAAGPPGLRLASGELRPGQDTRVEVRFEAVGEETRVTVEHTGWDSVPADHVARHGFPSAVLLQRHGEWWQSAAGQLSAAPGRASGRESPMNDVPAAPVLQTPTPGGVRLHLRHRPDERRCPSAS